MLLVSKESLTLHTVSWAMPYLVAVLFIELTQGWCEWAIGALPTSLLVTNCTLPSLCRWNSYTAMVNLVAVCVACWLVGAILLDDGMYQRITEAILTGRLATTDSTLPLVKDKRIGQAHLNKMVQ